MKPNLTFPPDYVQRVYAGVLGKLIGVYLGRPFEGWTYEQILERLGEIEYYVHEKLDLPLIVTDDDITGTFTFLRAMQDYGYSPEITAGQIGHTWLNYIIENETILWWGGMGNSTEHTAYLRLKAGIPAPQSGSMALNGKVVAEQIGAQIFIDGWGMLAPGDPAFAADLARRAASVSHDGEAIYGAQVIAAMEALAFVEADTNALIEAALALIPHDSVIYTMIQDIRAWRAQEADWRIARQALAGRYGYDTYGGNCHMVPNHGLIILALLYGEDDFQKSLGIVNTCGWDTDCNSGNLGCLLGIKNGLAGIDRGPDWRGPLADRLYLPTADGGRAISDAVSESYHIVNAARRLAGLEPLAPKHAARFHFELPGSVQGFVSEDSVASRGVARLENVAGHSLEGERSLAVHYRGLAPGRYGRIETATFIPSLETAAYFEQRGYRLLASPTLYPGQTLRARLSADEHNRAPVQASLYLKHYDARDELAILHGEAVSLAPGEAVQFTWQVPDTGGYPIAFAGLQVAGDNGQHGEVYLDFLTWDGIPQASFGRPMPQGAGRATMWKKAWVDGLDGNKRMNAVDAWPEPYRLVQNRGRGLLMQGTRRWEDYRLTARMTPHMCRAGGLAVRVQGLERYYALLLDGEKTRLVRAFEGRDTLLAEAEGGWEYGRTYTLNLQVHGNRLVATVDGVTVLQAEDPQHTFTGGGIALVCEAGRIGCESVEIGPVQE